MSGRARDWWLLVCVLALGMIVGGVWARDWQPYTQKHYRVLAPGQESASDGFSFRLTDVATIDVLRNPGDSKFRRKEARPGWVFVLAWLDVRADPGASSTCSLTLRTDDGELYPAVDELMIRNITCLNPVTARLPLAFELPRSRVEHVIGVNVWSGIGHVDEVLRPPA